MRTSSPTTRDRRAVRRTVLASAATMAIALGGIAFAVAGPTDRGLDSPEDTVRGFLISAVVDGNSVAGCDYLTPRAVRAFRTVEPPFTTCDEALTRARLVLGGEEIDDEAAVKGLSYRVERRGGRALVTVSSHGSAHTFGLRRASRQEREEFNPLTPSTSWRIDAGLDPLLT